MIREKGKPLFRRGLAGGYPGKPKKGKRLKWIEQKKNRGIQKKEGLVLT